MVFIRFTFLGFLYNTYPQPCDAIARWLVNATKSAILHFRTAFIFIEAGLVNNIVLIRKRTTELKPKPGHFAAPVMGAGVLPAILHFR